MNSSLSRGGVYQYKEVSAVVYADLMNAPSHGKYFNDNIKDAYPFCEGKLAIISFHLFRPGSRSRACPLPLCDRSFLPPDIPSQNAVLSSSPYKERSLWLIENSSLIQCKMSLALIGGGRKIRF